MINKICVYDFETDSADPTTCEPVQLAACIIHPVTLEIIKDSEFVTYMKPLDINDEGYFTEHLDTISWHANNYKCSPEQIFETWKTAPEQKSAFESFTNYLGKYNKNPAKPNRFGAPIRAGHNIRRFDDKIMDRLCERYDKLTKGEQNIFNPRSVIDSMDLSFYFFESLIEPESYALDSLRRFLGLSTDGAHDAMIDVRHTSIIISRFMKLLRSISPRVVFKNSCLSNA